MNRQLRSWTAGILLLAWLMTAAAGAAAATAAGMPLKADAAAESPAQSMEAAVQTAGGTGVSISISISAQCAVLMDAESGRVLYARQEHEPRLIASITKLMTALVAVEHAGDLDAPIEVRPEWTGIEGSSIYLKPGETVTLRELLYGLLLQSGNDAATAVACTIAGSEEAFAGLMNQKAAELGMKDSSFQNASGLDAEGHRSSAYDMALLARSCLANPAVAEICAAKSARVGTRTFVNHNKLLHRYEGCVGMKTGFTERAGRTLVSAATREGQTLICVTLHDPEDWKDHAALLDYGFSTWPRAALCTEGQIFGQVPVSGSLVPAVSAAAASGAGYPLAEGETLEFSQTLLSTVHAPVRPGMVLGEAVWSLEGVPVVRVPLVCSGSALLDVRPPQTFWERIQELLGL